MVTPTLPILHHKLIRSAIITTSDAGAKDIPTPDFQILKDWNYRRKSSTIQVGLLGQGFWMILFWRKTLPTNRGSGTKDYGVFRLWIGSYFWSLCRMNSKGLANCSKSLPLSKILKCIKSDECPGSQEANGYSKSLPATILINNSVS